MGCGRWGVVGGGVADNGPADQDILHFSWSLSVSPKQLLELLVLSKVGFVARVEARLAAQ